MFLLTFTLQLEREGVSSGGVLKRQGVGHKLAANAVALKAHRLLITWAQEGMALQEEKSETGASGSEETGFDYTGKGVATGGWRRMDDAAAR